MRLFAFPVRGLLVAVVFAAASGRLHAQFDAAVTKQLQLSPQAATDTDAFFHLLPSEEDQETGNAVPVLLRMVYEQQAFMKDVYPRLHEYAEMAINDPKLHELYFNRFADQIMRAGSMSFADWEYPLRGDRPYLILLPDIQSQRQLAGRGMTAWIKQRLSKGETDEALKGIRGQLACGRHCAATPVMVCNLVGLSLANSGFDNLELAIQIDKTPNMYWALASLPPTLQDLGPTVRWELWATPARLKEPLPPVGDEAWGQIARTFVDLYAESSNERYTEEEGESLKKNIERLALGALPSSLGFSDAEIQQMTPEERVMRWVYLQYCRVRTQIEPLTYQAPAQIIAAKNKIDAEHKELLAATGAKSSPYPVAIPQGILACRNFERRVKFLQTIEALRDHAGKHNGRLPPNLDELRLPAPNDPFTGKPLVYENDGKTVRLRQAEIEGFTTAVYDYELTAK